MSGSIKHCNRRQMAYSVGGGFGTSSGSSTFANPGIIKEAPRLLTDIQSGANQINNVQMPNNIDPTQLWNLQSNRLLQGMRPGEAARGMLTSGASQNAENQALGNLASQFTNDQFNRSMGQYQAQIGQGQAYSNTLLDALKAILNQSTTQKTSAMNANFNVGVG
jgi:hypothetical protein